MNKIKSMCEGLALACVMALAPLAKAQTPTPPRVVNVTNTATGVGSFQASNTVHQLTNGTTSVTSAPVQLYRGRGVALINKLSPTNALLTNIVSTWQVTPDGTNWMNEPNIVWRTGGAAIAAGSYSTSTNIPADFLDNYKAIRLNQVFLTNGVNTVGSAFLTNNGPTFAVSIIP